MLCRSLIIGIFVIFQLTSLIYIDVFGGIHQLILKNIIGWLAMTMIISIVSFSVFYRRNKIVVTVPAICFVIALLFLIMGLFYSKEIKNELLFLYSFGVAISILFYITGLQIKDRWWLQLFCIYCNVVFSLIQAFLTGYQFFAQPGIFYFATDMYSYGLLQQINIISTSIAASSLLAMMMFVLSKFSLVSYKYENLRAIVLGCAIFVFTLTLVILQSITTLLSFMGAIFLFIYLFYKKNKRRVIASCFLVALAVLIGVLLIRLCPQLINSESINQLHLKQMLWISIDIYNNFVGMLLISNDSYDITSLSFLGIERYIFTHPQSETFLGVMRGSNINLIFISFLITGGFYITIQSMAKYKKNDNGYSVAIVIAIIPIVIKCNIEIPFVLSVFNLANAILFLSFSDSAFSLKEQLFFYFNKKISTWLCIVMWIVFLSVFVFLERHIFFRTIVN